MGYRSSPARAPCFACIARKPGPYLIDRGSMAPKDQYQYPPPLEFIAGRPRWSTSCRPFAHSSTAPVGTGWRGPGALRVKRPECWQHWGFCRCRCRDARWCRRCRFHIARRRQSWAPSLSTKLALLEGRRSALANLPLPRLLQVSLAHHSTSTFGEARRSLPCSGIVAQRWRLYRWVRGRT